MPVRKYCTNGGRFSSGTETKLIAAAEKGNPGHAGSPDEVEHPEIVGILQPGNSPTQDELCPERPCHGQDRSPRVGPLEGPGPAFHRGPSPQTLITVDLGNVCRKTLDQPLTDDRHQANRVAEGKEEEDGDHAQDGGRDQIGGHRGGPGVAVRHHPREHGGQEGPQKVGRHGQVRHKGTGPQLVGQGGLDHAHVDHGRCKEEESAGGDENEPVAPVHLGTDQDVIDYGLGHGNLAMLSRSVVFSKPTSPDFSVRRGKAAIFSGCKSHPATVAPAGSNRSSGRGNRAVEAFGVEGRS